MLTLLNNAFGCCAPADDGGVGGAGGASGAGLRYGADAPAGVVPGAAAAEGDLASQLRAEQEKNAVLRANIKKLKAHLKDADTLVTLIEKKDEGAVAAQRFPLTKSTPGS